MSINGSSSSDPGHSQTLCGDDNEETKERAGEEQAHDPEALPNASAKKIFGTMRPNLAARKGNDAYNHEEKYFEDAPYEETAPNARVWRTYEDESRIHDANMVEESRDNVDVLLVLAGLFSAVVTTFVAQTYQNLQADYTTMFASLLFEPVLGRRYLFFPAEPHHRLCSRYHGRLSERALVCQSVSQPHNGTRRRTCEAMAPSLCCPAVRDAARP
ncbi:hypothetical protein EV421DRAFT_1903869 [Armillaria borealis]|uniref:DUF6535 domain-containing protein n=1 Tax=Armillaria borealis TaxID=47425 RepID=A0AA39JHJ7_9AGAR|nr:hypothetical protein EV421DRAFT_1903869 [Armillaria borealis]